MKEYEIVAKLCNACTGSSWQETFFEEVEPKSTEVFVKMKHSKGFDKSKKEILPNWQIIYPYDNSSVSYPYEFTPLE